MHRRIQSALVGLAATFWLAGCADLKCERVHQSNNPVLASATSPVYRVGCPDVLLVTFTNRPDWDSLSSVDVDGTLPLPESLGRQRVQGLTLDEIRDALAKAGQLKPEAVSVTLADPRSARVYVTGPVNATTRSVPYRGEEPVLELLVRIGAIQSHESNLNRVYVLRPNVAAGEKADVFHVDVDAVVLDGEQRTNIPVLPGDQIYVGETRRSSFSRLLPAWARPYYRKLVGLLPTDPQWWWSKEE